MFSLSKAKRPAAGTAGRIAHTAPATPEGSSKPVDAEILPPRPIDRKRVVAIGEPTAPDRFGRTMALGALLVAMAHAGVAIVNMASTKMLDTKAEVQLKVELPSDIVAALAAARDARPAAPASITISIPRTGLPKLISTVPRDESRSPSERLSSAKANPDGTRYLPLGD